MFDLPAVAVALLVAGAYLIGTVPTAQLVGARRGVDPTAAGSGNPGASNVYRLLGRRAGAAVLAVDLLKGLVPTLIALLAGGRALAAACGIAAVAGHVLPATRRFRGGKGVATAAGVAIVLWPLVSAVLVLVFVVVAAAGRIASVGSLTIALGLPLGVALTVVVADAPLWELLPAGVLSAVVVVRHAGNIRRLARGQERSIQRVRPQPPPME